MAVRPVVATVQLGQCGNQLGLELHDTLLREAAASGDAAFLRDTQETFFRTTETTSSSQGKLVARAVLVDTEPKVVEGVMETARRSKGWQYDARNAYHQQGGAANNWSFGYKHLGPTVWSNVADMIRREFEAADMVGGVLLLGSLAGGTGSGVGTYVTEMLRSEYRKSLLLNGVVWPYSTGEVIVQNYNVCLSLSHVMQDTDGVIMIENDHIHDICTKLLHINHVTFSSMNSVISQHLANILLPSNRAVSVPLGGVSLTEPIRNFLDPVAHLCCHPSYKFLTLKTIPQMPSNTLAFCSNTWPSLLKHLRQMLIVNAHIDEAMDWSVQLPADRESGILTRMSSRVGARQPPTPQYQPPHHIVSVSNMLVLRGGQLSTADTVPFTHRALYAPWSFSPLLVSGNHWPLGGCDKTAALLSNSQAVAPSIDRVLSKALLMYDAKAYVHHYATHGIDDEAFTVRQ
eukprot:TRINITY_DN5021_c0_g1_i6.p1 TRINITY_DN5021_c0_g1~~TRINITY_DN5021_c0_g1_i6.p1  ORF type:complete len:476 (+),score=109.97 TRINITY_DN5021_c0_g1_i6:54-1430(+)